MLFFYGCSNIGVLLLFNSSNNKHTHTNKRSMCKFYQSRFVIIYLKLFWTCDNALPPPRWARAPFMFFSLSLNASNRESVKCFRLPHRLPFCIHFDIILMTLMHFFGFSCSVNQCAHWAHTHGDFIRVNRFVFVVFIVVNLRLFLKMSTCCGWRKNHNLTQETEPTKENREEGENIMHFV